MNWSELHPFFSKKMKIPIDQYDRKLHRQVFLLMALFFLCATLSAWIVQSLMGSSWQLKIMEYLQIYWSKPADEAKLIDEFGTMSMFAGPSLLAHLVLAISMPFILVSNVFKMNREVDFSQPKQFMLRPSSLLFSPVFILIAFVVLLYNGFDNSTHLSRLIFGTPLLLVWIPASYAGSVIIFIRIAAALMARSFNNSN